jgi:Domain of unknown function (DUF4350)
VKDRWITLLLAIGAFAAFFRFFIGSVHPAQEEHSRPLSTETRANGYAALRRWIETQGIEVTDLRRRYDWFEGAAGLPARGNLLITTIPHKRAIRWSERSALRKWVQQGNVLLVVAGIFDTPEWGVPDTGTLETLHQLTGLSVREQKRNDERGKDAADKTKAARPRSGPAPFLPLAKPKRSVMRPIAAHPLTDGVRIVRAESEYPAGKFEIVSPENAPVLSLMADAESGAGALWLTWLGEGRVLVSGYGSIFTNELIAMDDNAALAANAIAAALGPDGQVIFDDIHQGAASFYDVEAFFGDPRLHASFWWVVALWLVWVVGGTRLPPPTARPEPVREREFLLATGNFFARMLDRRRAALRLFANFFNEHRRTLGLPPDGEPLWPWLRSFGSVTPGDLDRLETLYRRAAAGRRLDLVDLHNRLQRLRKQLA